MRRVARAEGSGIPPGAAADVGRAAAAAGDRPSGRGGDPGRGRHRALHLRALREQARAARAGLRAGLAGLHDPLLGGGHGLGPVDGAERQLSADDPPPAALPHPEKVPGHGGCRSAPPQAHHGGPRGTQRGKHVGGVGAGAAEPPRRTMRHVSGGGVCCDAVPESFCLALPPRWSSTGACHPS